MLLSNGRKRSPNESDSNRLIGPSVVHENSRNAESLAVRTNPLPESKPPTLSTPDLSRFFSPAIGEYSHNRWLVFQHEDGRLIYAPRDHLTYIEDSGICEHRPTSKTDLGMPT